MAIKTINDLQSASTPILGTELKLSIPKEISSQVYGKYLFDVIATKNNLTTKILQGNIFITELVAP